MLSRADVHKHRNDRILKNKQRSSRQSCFTARPHDAATTVSRLLFCWRHFFSNSLTGSPLANQIRYRPIRRKYPASFPLTPSSPSFLSLMPFFRVFNIFSFIISLTNSFFNVYRYVRMVVCCSSVARSRLCTQVLMV